MEVNNLSYSPNPHSPLTGNDNGNGSGNGSGIGNGNANNENPLFEKYYFTDNQITYLQELQTTLKNYSKNILKQAKNQNYKSITCQILMFSLGLVTSYVSAISDIDSTSKTYLTASLSLFNAFISGTYSLLKFSKTSTQLFGSYHQLRERENKINSAIVNGYSNLNFELLIEQTNKTIAQNEIYVNEDIKRDDELDKKSIPLKRLNCNGNTPSPSRSLSPSPKSEIKQLQEIDKFNEKMDEIKIEMKSQIREEFKDEFNQQNLDLKKDFLQYVVKNLEEGMKDKIKEEIKSLIKNESELKEDYVTPQIHI